MRPTSPARIFDQTGFTLVEVLVAVAITALLAGTAAALLAGTLGRERQSIARTMALAAAEQVWTDRWTGSEDDIDADPAAFTAQREAAYGEDDNSVWEVIRIVDEQDRERIRFHLRPAPGSTVRPGNNG